MAEWQAAQQRENQRENVSSSIPKRNFEEIVSEEKKRELLLLLSPQSLPTTRPRRPSLEFLREQQEALHSAPMVLVSHSVLPPIPSSLSSSIDTTHSQTSSNLLYHEADVIVELQKPFPLADSYHFELQNRPKTQPLPHESYNPQRNHFNERREENFFIEPTSNLQPSHQPLSIADSYNSAIEQAHVQNRPQTSSSRLDTAASFLIGRSTDSGRIRFTQSLKPAEEILRKRLDELEVAIDEEMSEHGDELSNLGNVDDTLDDLIPPLYDHSFSSKNSQVQVKDRENEISVKYVENFDQLPDIDGLQEAIELLGDEKIRQLYDYCREEDTEKLGYLVASKVLRAFIDLVPGVVRRKSVWRCLIIRIAPQNERIAYGKLFAALHAQKMEVVNEVEAGPSLAEVIVEEMRPLLPSRPSTQQVHKEVIRRQVIAELSSLISREPNVDLNRLTLSTNKTILAQEEMNELIEKSGLSTTLAQLKEPLFDSFRTHDERFHFGAFVGCLDRVSRSKTTDFSSAPIDK